MEEKFMLGAIKEAKKGMKAKHGGPFGAVIVDKVHQKRIAKAHNTVLKTNIATRHAEINAIERACKKLGTYDLSNCEIYSTTEPCPLCASAIHWAKIKTVYYGTSISDAKEFDFNEIVGGISKQILAPLNVESGILREECYQLFLDYEKRKGEKY